MGRATVLSAVARLLLTATGILTGYFLLPMEQKPSERVVVTLVVGLAALVALFVWQIRCVIRSPTPQLRGVQALATTIQLFLLLFASAYYLLERASPGSFSEPLTRTDALYFSLVTFSTVGYGDITAQSEAARIVTMAQVTGNLILIGVATRIVVTAVTSGSHTGGAQNTGR
ncbi:potassium channel family protein [Streptomyces sp. Edi4]|uniref:potassium channel family protein n=1 Tax=Streptomyces sp. Edi4 TaxID=3162527 RepID=UPI0033060CC5